jgi:integrase
LEQTRYQFGRLELKRRKTGPDVWVYRYYQRNPAGTATDRSVTVGAKDKYPTEARAWAAVERKGLPLLANPDQPGRNEVSVGMLLGRYLAEELPQRYSTGRSYRSYIEKRIEPKWKEYALAEVKTLAVEQWINSLPLAGKSRRHVRGIMRVIFQCAVRWELISKNPIDLVRVKGGTKRMRIPRVLEPEEFSHLLRELEQPYRTMVLIAGGLGLRASEIVALQWGDFDWRLLILTVTRGCVQGRLGEVKTEYSHQPLPLDPDLAKEILRWKGEGPYPNKGPKDFVFPNLDTGKPMWQESILDRHIKPAAERAELGSIGWHTFRHSYRAWLDDTNAPILVQRDLMRHASIQMTADYGKRTKVSDQKREVHSRVVKMILPKEENCA